MTAADTSIAPHVYTLGLITLNKPAGAKGFDFSVSGFLCPTKWRVDVEVVVQTMLHIHVPLSHLGDKVPSLPVGSMRPVQAAVCWASVRGSALVPAFPSPSPAYHLRDPSLDLRPPSSLCSSPLRASLTPVPREHAQRHRRVAPLLHRPGALPPRRGCE